MTNKKVSNYWNNISIPQQPDWGNKETLKNVLIKLQKYPNLVFPDEINLLKQNLISASKGKSFIIQGGDCAETFSDFSELAIKNKIKILLQMSAIIKYITKLNVINIGRIAGQFAKPRSNQFETRGNITLPSYRGDAVNDIKFDTISRQADPYRLYRAYHQSAATMNLIRSLIMDGFMDFNNIQSWGTSFLNNSHYVEKYNNITQNIKEVLNFAKNNTLNYFYESNKSVPNSIFTSHECLLLNFEKTFLQYEKNQTLLYNCSAHMLWVGDRTRHINGPHVKFLSHIQNPIGVKIGPTIDCEDIEKLCQNLNKKNEPGKLVLIIRFGVNYIHKLLPKIIEIVQTKKLQVIWMCDPMHGNTITSKTGYKTRSFDTIIKELEAFFNICFEYNIIPGGVHFELTGENVTECIGGMNNIKEIDLNQYYQTACDPRLNNEQSLEMAFLISEYINKRREF